MKPLLKPHRHGLRVYYEDTDFSGLVYHAAYLKFLERGRTEWLRAEGIAQSLLFEQGLGFVVVRMEIDFIKPAIMDDDLVVETTITKVGSARLVFGQSLYRNARNARNARNSQSPVQGASNADNHDKILATHIDLEKNHDNTASSLVNAVVEVACINAQRRPMRLSQVDLLKTVLNKCV